MVSTVASIETQHEDMIHDVQMDYYGKRLATASSDRTIRVFEVVGDKNTLLTQLKGHEGPVWQVAWAHPKFGSLLASCSFDHTVVIWKETNQSQWEIVHRYAGHGSSVNSVAWAPHEFGLMLACGSSDGQISVLSSKADGSWDEKRFPGHGIGVNAVSWAPAVNPGALVHSTGSPVVTTPPSKRFVSGGCDNLVKIWRLDESTGEWQTEAALEEHSDWVRDVSWAPNIGLPSSTIASCSQDGRVIIWTQDEKSLEWRKVVLSKFPTVVWRLSWSVNGNILAVSGGDNRVSLWKESLEGDWSCISDVDEGAVTADQGQNQR
eukprot:Colp12_sorted_trinity150504_noHs@32576